MTDIIFSFDTEDFTCSRAADGIIEVAEILRSEGIRGCFNIVGLLADQLVAWGRTDVLEALKYHEIDFHSYGHSLHPCINEYTNIEDHDAAYRELVSQESEGVAKVRAATGADRLWEACAPGNNENYIAMYAYTNMGIPCYSGTLLDTPGGQNVFYCNALYLHYYTSVEQIDAVDGANDASFYDRMADRQTVVLYNHPNKMLYRNFWDVVNYHHGVNLHPFGEWEEAERKTEEEREHIRDQFRTLVRTLKADGRFRFRTYREIAEERCFGVREVKREDMPGLRKRLLRDFGPQRIPTSLCISDIFAAAVSYLKGNALFRAGRVYGFLDTPYAITEPTTVRAEDVCIAAQSVDLSCFLPTSFMVGDTRLGPADFLFAMLAALDGEEEINLTPREQNINISCLGNLSTPPVDGWLFAKDFKAEILKKRTPLQAWTVRY